MTSVVRQRPGFWPQSSLRLLLLSVVPGLLFWGAGPAEGAEEPRDLVLITIDTWRHDAVPWQQGRYHLPAPALEKVAREGRVFPRAYAHNTLTLPSHVNMLSGLYPYQHGVRDNAGFMVPVSLPTLATMLRQQGFATGAFVSALTLDSRFGIGRGFDVYDQPRGSKGGRELFQVGERRAEETAAKALAWWRQEAGKRRFLWLHLFDPHAPYDPPEPFRGRFPGEPYRGEIAAADHFLTTLLADLRRDGALLAITADHGEGLGDHGEATHGNYAWDSTLRVPLLLWGKGVSPGQDERLARHIDLAPTLLLAVGLKLPPGSLGHSLLSPPVEGITSYFEALAGHFSFGWAPLRGLVQGTTKIYEKPVPELYDLAQDPGELNNLESTQRRRLQALRRLLPEESSWPPARGTEVAPEVAAALRSLGYLSDSAPKKLVYGPEDDPHRLVDLAAAVVETEALFAAGRFEDAAAKGAELLKRRPVPAAYTLRVQALLELGRREEALRTIEEAVAKESAARELWQQWGLTLLELGRAKEAVSRLAAEAKRSEEPRLQSIYALALAESGQPAEGFTVLEKAAAAAPGDAEVQERLSVLALGLERPALAEEAARKALAADPSRAHAWNNLGVALFLRGQRKEALAAWEKAVELSPAMVDTWYNLGLKAAELGEPAKAKKALREFLARAPRDRYRSEIENARRLLATLP